MTFDPDAVDRVQKLLVDADGITFEQAARLLRSYRLQIIAGPDWCASHAGQAAILTAVNAGTRAVHGGVDVRLGEDVPCSLRLFEGLLLSEAITQLRGHVVDVASDSVPTIVFGEPSSYEGLGPTVCATAGQWCAAAAPDPVGFDSPPSVLAAVASAGLAVSECFQRLRGFPVACERTVALSFWEPGTMHDGPIITELVDGAWLLGLGHLGQAYAWLLALMPYEATSDARKLIVQDDDRLSIANGATSMLDYLGQPGIRKTRLVARALEPLDWDVAVVERRYVGGRLRQPHDPALLLGGVDNPQARHRLDETGFDLIIDAGLGAGPDGYLDMTIRRLPGSRSSSAIWPQSAPARVVDLTAPGYRQLRERHGDRCGVEQLAGRTVATAFVGVTAACWTIGLALRELYGQMPIELIDFSLRAPDDLAVIASQRTPARLAGVRARHAD